MFAAFKALAVAVVCAVAGVGCASGKAAPVIASSEVEYRAALDGPSGPLLTGHLASPAGDGAGVKRPAVLVVHEWWGRGGHADQSAEALARLGYVGFAVDMYGEARQTKDPEVAGAWAGGVRKNKDVEISRVRAAMDYLRSLPNVDATRMAVIGYCFGGTVSLDSAWAGLDLRAVVSFHGSLTAPTPEQVPGVKASILICHGADDPFVPEESIEALTKALRDGKLDWAMTYYGNAVHSFTNPAADGSFNPGALYNAAAARRSWSQMESFLAERFARSPQQ